jgi:hypothetical protein
MTRRPFYVNQSAPQAEARSQKPEARSQKPGARICDRELEMIHRIAKDVRRS